MIESAANAKFKRIQKLMKQARARKKEGVFVVEGWKMVHEALQRDLVQELYCDEKEEQALAKELAKLQKRPVIEVLKTTLFKQMSDTVNPQGVLAVITMPSYDREQMISSSECKLLCLENIQDPGNLGTMFRTAEGAGLAEELQARSEEMRARTRSSKYFGKGRMLRAYPKLRHGEKHRSLDELRERLKYERRH